MDLDQHASGIGKLVGNFQTLECVLRIYLCEDRHEPINFPEPGSQHVQETHLTNFDTLGELIDKYNATLDASTKPFQIDRSVVAIRDAIAHGRVISNAPEPPIRLFKFNRPRNGVVTLAFDQLLDEKWFADSRELVSREVHKVVDMSRHRGFKSLAP
jgi:hypothetical protein